MTSIPAISPSEIRNSGSVLVIDGVRADLAQPLRAETLAQWATCLSQPSLNQGGWKSTDLRTWRSPAAGELRREILRVVSASEPSLCAWAMVNRRGDHHPRHVHRGAVASGVYVVDPGEGEPTPTLFEVGDREVAVVPVPGRLVLFSGDLWHRVPACAGEGPRVTVAFDFK